MKLTTIQNKLKGFKQIRDFGVPNQYQVEFNNGTIFQSYNSIIAIKLDGKIYLTDKWDYSTTTGKYRNQFLFEDKKTTQSKIDSGEYTILN